MENRTIIIILLAVIVVLAAMVGVMILHPFESKKASTVKITSDREIYEGESIRLTLCDLNRTPIAGEIINVTVYDAKGRLVVDDVIKTNSKGKGELDLDLKKGKYIVNASFGGNDNFTANATSQKLTIREKEIVEAQSTGSSSSDTYVERTEGNLQYGYKDGRYGFWTPTGNFIEDKSRALSGEDSAEPYMRDGSFYDQT